MEGRYPNGLLIALINYTDPSTEEQFNYWYNHIHIPDVTGFGVYKYGTRFVNPNPKPADGKYLTIYETEWDDLSKVQAASSGKEDEWRRQGRYDITHIQRVLVGHFKRLGGEFRATVRPAKGVLMVFANCKDPSKEDEFNRWYEDIHIPDILDTGLYQSAYRYESVEYIEDTTSGKYLAIYETDDPEPGRVAEQVGKFAQDWAQRGRMFDGVELTLAFSARRIWPAD